MKPLVLAAAALALTGSTPQYFRYRRPIAAPSTSNQTCVELDAATFAHAAPALKDLRLLYPDGHEIPYAITLSESTHPDSDPAPILNLGARPPAANPTLVFDLQMPPRPYSSLTLDLDAHNFLATASVSGLSDPRSRSSTSLGQFTLFDLAAQHLARSTTIALPESTFPYLHIALTLAPAPGSPPLRVIPGLVRAAAVPPTREAQTLYTTVATVAPTQSGAKTTASLAIPAHVPVERISVNLAPAFKGNFSRDLHLTATAQPGAEPDLTQTDPDPSGLPLAPETITGTIFRVHATETNRPIDDTQLSLPATLGANLQNPALVHIEIENGDDPPLPIAAIRLEMRQRKLCFDLSASSPQPVALFYGDPTLLAPIYDYARLFTPAANPTSASLGHETPNPTYQARPDTRSFTQRHPELLWAALLAVAAALALVAYRSAGVIHR